jgi:hypothetical protein
VFWRLDQSSKGGEEDEGGRAAARASRGASPFYPRDRQAWRWFCPLTRGPSGDRRVPAGRAGGAPRPGPPPPSTSLQKRSKRSSFERCGALRATSRAAVGTSLASFGRARHTPVRFLSLCSKQGGGWARHRRDSTETRRRARRGSATPQPRMSPRRPRRRPTGAGGGSSGAEAPPETARRETPHGAEAVDAQPRPQP